MITFVKGDLFSSDAQALVNTVNTVGIMGKGIALHFKKVFPYNYGVYRKACAAGELKIGSLLVVSDWSLLMGERTIINFPTKQHWRNASAYEFIEAGLVALRSYLEDSSLRSIAIPPLGCGNGGLKWDLVKPMLERHLQHLKQDIFVFEP